jgi:hypothetical protein
MLVGKQQTVCNCFKNSRQTTCCSHNTRQVTKSRTTAEKQLVSIYNSIHSTCSWDNSRQTDSSRDNSDKQFAARTTNRFGTCGYVGQSDEIYAMRKLLKLCCIAILRTRKALLFLFSLNEG